VKALDLAPEPPPLLVGNLEIVRLVAHHVEQRDLASEREVLLDRAGADRRAMQIAPPCFRFILTQRADHVGLGSVRSTRGRDARLDSGACAAKPTQSRHGELAAAKRERAREALERRALRAEHPRALETLARIAPRVFGFHERLERLARAHRRRRDDDQPVNRAPHDVELRRGRESRIELGPEGIDEHSELAAFLAEGLGPRAGPPRLRSPIVTWILSPG